MSNPTDPPLSRRAARQAELSAQDAPPEGFAQPPSRPGRGGTPVSVPSSAPSDVVYRTQVRPRVPHYDAAPLTHTVIVGQVHPTPGDNPVIASWPVELEPLVEPLVDPLVEPPVAPPAAFRAEQVRRRDFRPPAEQPESPTLTSTPTGPTFDTELAYQTQLTSGPEAAPAPDVDSDGAGSRGEVQVISPTEVRERTLSRRELRALREQLGLGPELSPEERESVVEPEPPALAQPTVSAPPSSSAPTGSHWTVGIHDEGDPFENTFSRQVGSTASLSNTNALVLPEMPLGSLSGPVSGTGEIIITGMIDLPRVVASTGAVPTVHESPDIDDLFDAGDLTATPFNAAPVSALRAVSSHTGTHGVMVSGKHPSNSVVTTVLVAVTVVMAAVAIGLFVLAAVNGLF